MGNIDASLHNVAQHSVCAGVYIVTLFMRMHPKMRQSQYSEFPGFFPILLPTLPFVFFVCVFWLGFVSQIYYSYNHIMLYSGKLARLQQINTCKYDGFRLLLSFRLYEVFDLTRNNFQRIFNLRTDRGKSTFDSSIVQAISYSYSSDLMPFNETKNLLAGF